MALNKFVIVLVAVITVSATLSLGAVTGYFGALGEGPSSTDLFAECLTQKDVSVYVMEGCTHCREQKQLFGSSFNYLSSTDCAFDLKKCTDLGIRNVPAWIIGGEKYEGVQSLEKLSEMTGCPL